ncbi:hypothetical protein AVEN_184620-1 [Araneus ventricosus]|uniref:Uncharacterized protein n=1 Tax=Araneus ventricosus TaxID=182803 RepID=A0A4Y2EB13_ARAVE|nr:hypothetical protein AVEN_184620-1 [Araneus ventricosus]
MTRISLYRHLLSKFPHHRRQTFEPNVFLHHATLETILSPQDQGSSRQGRVHLMIQNPIPKLSRKCMPDVVDGFAGARNSQEVMGAFADTILEKLSEVHNHLIQVSDCAVGEWMHLYEI